MAKKEKAPKLIRQKVGSVSDFSLVLTQKQDGAKLTFRAGEIGVVAASIEGCRVYPAGQASTFFDVKEPAEGVNAMVDACYRAAAAGFYDVPEPKKAPPPPANRHEKRAAAKKAA